MTGEYYVLEGGQKLGPYTEDELLARPLEPIDMVLLPLETEWKPAHTLGEFEAYFKNEGIYYPSRQNTAMYILRLPAYIIDCIILGFVLMIVAILFFGNYVIAFEQKFGGPNADYKKLMDSMQRHQTEVIIVQTILFFITVLYNATCESSRLRGSIGKYILGLAVVDYGGYSLTFGQAFMRNLGKIVYEVVGFVVGPFSYLFYLRMIWGDLHQAVHDRFSGCYVIKKDR